MSKIKIDTDVHAEETFKTEIEAKLNAFKTLLNNLEDFVATIDLKALYNNPEAYSKEAIINEYASSYKRIKHDKLFDLIGFDLSELKKQSDIFNSIGHHFDSKTLEYTTPDFNIYAITEDQIARYHAVNNAVKALLELSKHRAIHPGQLIQATNRALKPDYENSFVKGETTFVLTGGFPRGM